MILTSKRPLYTKKNSKIGAKAVNLILFLLLKITTRSIAKSAISIAIQNDRCRNLQYVHI